jgi:hypothetical protein
VPRSSKISFSPNRSYLSSQQFWKRILIVDDDEDITITFKAGIEDSNNNTDTNKRIEAFTHAISFLAK